jgi:hypothetical protein
MSTRPAFLRLAVLAFVSFVWGWEVIEPPGAGRGRRADGGAPWPAASPAGVEPCRGSLTIRSSGQLRGWPRGCRASLTTRKSVGNSFHPRTWTFKRMRVLPWGSCPEVVRRSWRRRTWRSRREDADASRPRSEVEALDWVTVKRGRVGVVKPPRARGGCLGVIRISGVGGRDRPGGAAERASIPGCPKRRRELKHLSTCGKGNQPRLPQ